MYAILIDVRMLSVVLVSDSVIEFLPRESLSLRLTDQFRYPKQPSRTVQSCGSNSIGIRILGLRCSWWHSRQVNDALSYK